ncbi:MAG: ribosome maturation factor RimM [Oscillospiraceae bacterium]|nr:ribosome maturation factor RimM [Oscillospiraceae bacterium]
MKKNLLEAGKIVNTHGMRGEVKIMPWADSPEFLMGFEHVFIDNAPVKILSSRAHKGCVIATLEGVSDIESAIRLKNRIVFIDRDEVELEEGQHFIADLVGLTAIDAKTGSTLGILKDVMSLPSNNVYLIKGEREILVPAVPEFVSEIDMESGIIKLTLIEGM